LKWIRERRGDQPAEAIRAIALYPGDDDVPPGLRRLLQLRVTRRRNLRRGQVHSRTGKGNGQHRQRALQPLLIPAGGFDKTEVHQFAGASHRLVKLAFLCLRCKRLGKVEVIANRLDQADEVLKPTVLLEGRERGQMRRDGAEESDATHMVDDRVTSHVRKIKQCRSKTPKRLALVEHKRIVVADQRLHELVYRFPQDPELPALVVASPRLAGSASQEPPFPYLLPEGLLDANGDCPRQHLRGFPQEVHLGLILSCSSR
jgi:hypothetical protein